MKYCLLKKKIRSLVKDFDIFEQIIYLLDHFNESRRKQIKFDLALRDNLDVGEGFRIIGNIDGEPESQTDDQDSFDSAIFNPIRRDFNP